jgi:uncharacterized protein (TIGR03083 family)
MEHDPLIWTRAMRRTHDSLVADVAEMAPDDLRRTSGASDWNVSQVLSHLGSGAEIAHATFNASMLGEEPPSNELNQPIWDRWNSMEPEARASAFVRTEEQFVELLESIDGSTAPEVTIKFPFMPVPVDLATAIGFRLSEHALHSWDVRVAFDDRASVPEYLADLLIDRLPGMAGYTGKADRWTRPPASIALLTDAPDRRFTLELGDAVALTEGAEESTADAVVRLPGESLLRLSAGRLAPARTPDDITVDGDVTLDELRAVFPGF